MTYIHEVVFLGRENWMKGIHKKSLLRRENWMKGFHEGVSLGQ
jgi:hypothetical protein